MDVKEVLISQGIYEFITNIKSETLRKEILSKCSLTEYKKGDIFYFSPEKEQQALIFLDGRVNLRLYINDSVDYTIPWNNEMWFGIFGALGAELRECDVNFLEDTKVLSFPLKKIMHSDPKENIELWIKTSEMAAKKHMASNIKNIKRAALSTEAYFLTSLAENGYNYENLSIAEISYDLNINTRTLQRLIQTLEKQGLIKREKINKKIYVKNRSKIDGYLAAMM